LLHHLGQSLTLTRSNRLDNDSVMQITEICAAILAVAGVLILAARAFLAPRMRALDLTLARIESRLEKLNGSVGDTAEWRHRHEIEHARTDQSRIEEKK
jgi:hypothetical protein